MECYDLRPGGEELAGHHLIHPELLHAADVFFFGLAQGSDSAVTLDNSKSILACLFPSWLVGILPKAHVILVEVFLESIRAE